MHIFTYGTLMAPAVWTRVVAGTYDSTPVLLNNFKRLCVAGETYPGLIQSPGGKVEGVVYFDVSDRDVQRLDLFEGNEYERIAVLAVSENGAEIPCQTYVFKEECRHYLTDTEWSYEEFLKSGMKDFLATYGGWENE